MLPRNADQARHLMCRTGLVAGYGTQKALVGFHPSKWSVERHLKRKHYFKKKRYYCYFGKKKVLISSTYTKLPGLNSEPRARVKANQISFHPIGERVWNSAQVSWKGNACVVSIEHLCRDDDWANFLCLPPVCAEMG